jgi:DnaK suppressor protein
MTKAELDKHKKKLMQLRRDILNGGLLKASEELHVSTDDLADETDLASSVIHQNISFSIRNRELLKLRQVESAIQRIDDGHYGVCEECDEEIEEVRLRNQPWTNLCIIHAEEREREGSKYRQIG